MNRLTEVPRPQMNNSVKQEPVIFGPIIVTSLNVEKIKDRTPMTLGNSCPDASCPIDACRNKDTQPHMNSCGPSCPRTCRRTCMYCDPKR